ncbi:MAG: MBL fold metallo-hydrolase [Thermoplasmata archaeon]|nr:MBL fold metallo-hydrolase [Thermoplasmata archaeon]
MVPKIDWLGHASFRIETEDRTIYIDPWKLKGGKRADLILITHTHMDHFNLEDIKKISGPDTRIICTTDAEETLPNLVKMSPGESREEDGIKIKAHRAYNISKEFHPRENNWVGYVVDIDGYRIYHSGDTDVIPEMDGVKDIDVALLPVGGTYTMTPEEAARAVSMIKPKKVIPMHWGDIVGSREDAERFRKLVDCEVEILEVQE